MNLQTFEMPAQEARTAFREYRAALRVRHVQQREDVESIIRREDEMIMRTYRLLARGARLINLPDTIANGGRDELDRPKLAVARADQRQIRLAAESTRWYFCGEQATIVWRYHHQHSRAYCIPAGAAPALKAGEWRHPAYSAVVPLIPAPLRPDNALEGYHILWEAEWRRVAPRDPALLKHVGGDMYAVVAVWDLTEVERMALGIRLKEMRV